MVANLIGVVSLGSVDRVRCSTCQKFVWPSQKLVRRVEHFRRHADNLWGLQPPPFQNRSVIFKFVRFLGFERGPLMKHTTFELPLSAKTETDPWGRMEEIMAVANPLPSRLGPGAWRAELFRRQSPHWNMGLAWRRCTLRFLCRTPREDRGAPCTFD